MSKTLKIFSYDGCVGATSDMSNGKFINDVTLKGQLGVVVAIEDVSITSDALHIMKTNFSREGGSFAGCMVTRSTNPEYSNSIALLDFGVHSLAIYEPILFSRDCDLTVLDDIFIDDELNIPIEFIEYVAMEKREREKLLQKV